MTIKGTRIYPQADGYLSPAEMAQSATYGRATAERVRDMRAGWWQVTAPDGSVGSLNPAIHQITEHEDGTITVVPSLDYSQRKPGAWHGFLTRGEFSSC